MGAVFTDTRTSPPSRRPRRVSNPSTRSPARLRASTSARRGRSSSLARSSASPPSSSAAEKPVSFTSAAFQTITARSRSTAQTSALACSIRLSR